MGLLKGWGEGFDCPDMYGDNDDRLCARCGVPIGKRRQRWCSDACGRWFGDNHWFNYGRIEVKSASRVDGGYRCAECLEVVGTVEVDHLEAANGAHARKSCLHHTTNLRALCVPCHRKRTRLQRAQR